jgi:16S rRNA (uracil1498-N3)-methyltransferase
MDTFYCPPSGFSGDRVEITGEELDHLVHVMRKKPGDVIRVVDGAGVAVEIVLETAERRSASGLIRKRGLPACEAEISLILGVGVLKNPARLDFCVEKATELGVKEIVPLKTARTIPGHAKHDRWQKLALAAMKQSGRSVLPRVHELTPLPAFLEYCRECSPRLVAHEGLLPGSVLCGAVRAAQGPMACAVGPEGGFSEEELEGFTKAGWNLLYLGERRLRTETAAIVTVAALLSPQTQHR